MGQEKCRYGSIHRTIAGAFSRCFLRLRWACCRLVSQGWRARTCWLWQVLAGAGQRCRATLSECISYWILKWWMLWCKGKDFKFEKENTCFVEVKYYIQCPTQGDLGFVISSLTQSFCTCFTRNFYLWKRKAYWSTEGVVLGSPEL